MNRLLGSDGTSPVERRASELLRTMEPLRLSDDRVARIRRALDAAPARRLARPRAMVLLAAAAVLVAAAASAAVGSGLLGPRGSKQDAAPGAVATATAAVANGRAPGVSGSADVPSTADPGAVGSGSAFPGLPSAAGPLAPGRAPQVTTAASTAAGPPPTRASAAGPASSSGGVDAAEVALIHDAAKALRHDQDPEAAAKLLAKVDRKRNGPLAEEALALSIEAATARRDPGAAALGRDYLARYPKGRYRDIALRAAQQGGSK